ALVDESTDHIDDFGCSAEQTAEYAKHSRAPCWGMSPSRCPGAWIVPSVESRDRTGCAWDGHESVHLGHGACSRPMCSASGAGRLLSALPEWYFRAIMAKALSVLERNILKAKGLTETDLKNMAAAGIKSKEDFHTVGDATTLAELISVEAAV